MKQTITCLNCDAKFKVIWDDEDIEEIEYCPFCSGPLDYELEPLDFKCDQQVLITQ